jgi:hypothetical protein
MTQIIFPRIPAPLLKYDRDNEAAYRLAVEQILRQLSTAIAEGSGTPTPRMSMGELGWYGNTTATVITTADTWTRVAPVAGTLGAHEEFTSKANGRLNYSGPVTTILHMGCTLSVKSAGPNDVIKAIIYKNGGVNGNNEYTSGTALTNGTVQDKTLLASDLISTAIHVMPTAVQPGDYFELAIKNVSDGDDLTVTEANLFAVSMVR